ncbi:hypothetical protein Q1695_004956 [Nippostrongylus brasiliensis]|nr:hypothetical protein Q1695_004956 [Nippostrongylus brasiliensis]
MTLSRILLSGGGAAFLLLWGFTFFGDYTSNFIPAETSTEMNDPPTSTIENSTAKPVNPFDQCIMPTFDPWDEDIIPFVNLDYNPLRDCNHDFKRMTTLNNGILTAHVPNVTCWGRCLTRKSELTNKVGNWVNIDQADFRCDIVESKCEDDGGKVVYQMVHAQIIERESKERIKIDETLYDVYVLLLDSTASSQAIRNLPRTMHFFENSMKAVTFPHVNKVGLNSRPNGVALWFGKRMEQVDRSLFGLPNLEPEWSTERFCKNFLDNETFLLKEYSEKGYKTLLAEDWMHGTLNWPKCKGFKQQPTDHYMRPFQIAVEKDASKALKSTYNKANCIEEHQDILQYLQDFVNAYKGQPKFGWIWLSLLGHDHESGVIHADPDFHRFLLDNKKKLDNSFVIILGDHGLRGGRVTRTKLGSLEMSNPLFAMSVPKTLRNTTDILSILKENAGRLQTHYDIRATLLDILKYQPADGFQNRTFMSMDGEHGSSMLRSQTDAERTCRNLPIPISYCTCQYPMENIKRSSTLATRAGKFLIEHVNLVLRRGNASDLCDRLRFKHTITISAYAPEKLSKTYAITVKAQRPSGAEFKAVVRSTKWGRFEMASKSIDRLDRFGKSGNCVEDWLKHLCHCKTPPVAKKEGNA